MYYSDTYTSLSRRQASSPQKSLRSLCDFKVGSDKVASGPNGTGLRPSPMWSLAKGSLHSVPTLGLPNNRILYL